MLLYASCLASKLSSWFYTSICLNILSVFDSYVFLLDTGLEIFIWRGANATLGGTTKAR